MSDIKPKEGADLIECVRLAFNSRVYNNLTKGPNGYKFLEKRMEADNLLDQWFVQNLDGLPEQVKSEG